MKPSRFAKILMRMFLVAALILVGYAGSQGRDARNFWVLNNTGKKISRFYVSPHESYSWGSDVLGQAELPNGIGALISFDSSIRSSCTMDFKLVFDDGSEQLYRQGRNVCLLVAVQFNRQDSVGLK